MTRRLAMSCKAVLLALSVALMPWLPSAQAHGQGQPGGQPAPLPPGANASLDSARAIRGAALQVSLITYGIGEGIWERFGHNAISVRDTVSGRDVAYNWGVFSFDEPNLLVRFLAGDALYRMEGAYTAPFNADYVADNRTIRMQHLAFTPTERAAMLEFLEWNNAEENKRYRYDYYRDNCSTRARDAIDRVLKGRLKAVLDTGTTPRTWRSETERSMAAVIPAYAGIELALGRDADKNLSRWSESFMPERLADALAPLVIRNDAGLRYRVVDRDTVLFTSTRVPLPIDPPDRLAMAALLGLTLAGLIAFVADSRFKAMRVVLVTFVALWYTIGGLAGTALMLAGTVTKHAPYMGHNITLWQLHPLLLVAAVVVPFAIARQNASRFARAVGIGAAVLALVGALLQLVPGLSQHSGVIIAVVLPVHMVIAATLLRIHASTPRRASGAAAMARAA